MADSLEVREPLGGTELFVEPVGERRLSFAQLVEVDSVTLDAFQTALRAYMAAHPKLEVVTLHAKATDEIVFRWRWRR